MQVSLFVLLVRSIQQNVLATTESNKNLSGNESAGYNMHYDYSGSVITTSSIKEIPGVTFSQTWIASNGTVYTLALLNRQEAGRYYRQKIADLSAVVESEIVFATAHSGTFAALRALQNAVETAWENQGYIDTLYITVTHYFSPPNLLFKLETLLWFNVPSVRISPIPAL